VGRLGTIGASDDLEGSVQASNVGGLRAPRGPRVVFAVALACWGLGALVFAMLPAGSDARFLAAVGISWAATTFAILAILGTLRHTERPEQTVWALIGGGMIARFVGDVFWTASQVFEVEVETPALAPQDFAYAVSYPLLFAALIRLVTLAQRRFAPVIALDALGVMLSVGTLIWYFVLGPNAAEAGLLDGREVLVALSQPVCDAALLFLSLVVLTASGRPRYVELLTAGFLAFLIADTWYLKVRSVGPYEGGDWPELFWALGLVLLGLAALRTAPVAAAEVRIEPWRVFAFWLGPLSPPIQLGIVLAWGVTHPPLPAYVGAGAAILFFYLALRVALVSFVNRRLGRDQEETARKVEQGRILYELHDTVKQGVHGISLSLRAALDAGRRGEHDDVRRMLERALEVSQEAEYRVSQPYDELQAIHGEVPSNPSDYLRHRLKRFEEYFGIETHEDFRVPFEFLRPAEVAAAQRVFVEASWNAIKHAQARNLWLETRRVGSVVIVRIRDDGRGFDAGDPPPGLGLRYMRRRAEEVGAELDVISTPDRGTTIQLRFDNR
jgi:signal transduction histidine kinase